LRVEAKNAEEKNAEEKTVEAMTVEGENQELQSFHMMLEPERSFGLHPWSCTVPH
jgi:hypothetical protein